MEFKHTSVLLNECIENLNIKSNGIYADGTLGGGGHSFQIASQLSEKGILIGIDQDKNALKAASEKLKDFQNVQFVHDNFSNIKNIFNSFEFCERGLDGMLMDLGVSSHQLDEAERGFSYMHDAPLDMRMNRDNSFSAYDVINEYSKENLTQIIKDYGEERWAKRIAEFICNERNVSPIKTTYELVSVIKKAIPKGARQDGPHPAKRTFQAIRIEVNGELKILKDTISDIADILNTGGRIAIITFHSLEDRIVKNAFRDLENPCICPRDFPICVCGKKPKLKVITRKPILPSADELAENHRSRSAKLRVAEKI